MQDYQNHLSRFFTTPLLIQQTYMLTMKLDNPNKHTKIYDLNTS
jgi:hypothetical protein